MESLKAVLTEEGLVSFECKVVGFPTPLLRWFKDGQELKPGDVYQLTGTNSLGTQGYFSLNIFTVKMTILIIFIYQDLIAVSREIVWAKQKAQPN